MTDEPKRVEATLAEMKAVCDAATEGPLDVFVTLTLLSIRGQPGTRNGIFYKDGPVLCRMPLCPNPEAASNVQALANMQMFAQARTGWPRAIAAVGYLLSIMRHTPEDVQAQVLPAVARILAGEGG